MGELKMDGEIFELKSRGFWHNEIKNAGVEDKLLFFNDVVTEKKPPHNESGYHLVLNNIILDGKNCDIYHTDQDEQGNSIEDKSNHRIYIHIKE